MHIQQSRQNSKMFSLLSCPFLEKRKNRLFSSSDEEDPAAAYLHIFFGHFSFFFWGGNLFSSSLWLGVGAKQELKIFGTGQVSQLSFSPIIDETCGPWDLGFFFFRKKCLV